MSVPPPQGQLELFDVARQPYAKPRPPSLGRFLLTLRYDQAVLCGIAGLIGVTVVFACGVERGKQLNRTERALITRDEFARPAVTPLPMTPPATMVAAPVEAASTTKRTSSTSAPAKRVPLVVPATSVKKKEPSKLAATTDRRRYAVQAASYRQAPLAKRELDRLMSSGERAFLVTKGGHTIVYLGPFPSKTHASEKLTMFKSRYQGCFIRTL
jgi:cell division protein FtsN